MPCVEAEVELLVLLEDLKESLWVGQHLFSRGVVAPFVCVNEVLDPV